MIVLSHSDLCPATWSSSGITSTPTSDASSDHYAGLEASSRAFSCRPARRDPKSFQVEVNTRSTSKTHFNTIIPQLRSFHTPSTDNRNSRALIDAPQRPQHHPPWQASSSNHEMPALSSSADKRFQAQTSETKMCWQRKQSPTSSSLPLAHRGWTR